MNNYKLAIEDLKTVRHSNQDDHFKNVINLLNTLSELDTQEIAVNYIDQMAWALLEHTDSWHFDSEVVFNIVSLAKTLQKVDRKKLSDALEQVNKSIGIGYEWDLYTSVSSIIEA